MSGILPQQNGMSKAEISTFAQSNNNVPFGRGFGLSKVTGAQQWQKSDSTTVSVNAVSTENTFTLGVGRGKAFYSIFIHLILLGIQYYFFFLKV